MTQINVHNRGKVSDKETGKCSIYCRSEKDHSIMLGNICHQEKVHGSADPQLSSQHPTCLMNKDFNINPLGDQRGLSGVSHWEQSTPKAISVTTNIQLGYYSHGEGAQKDFWELEHHFH